MLIATEDKALGAVWLGVYPMEDRIDEIKEIFNLPASVIPLSIIPVGYSNEY